MQGGFTVTHESGWYKARIAAGGGPAAARSTLSRAWPATRLVVESHLVPRRFVNDDAVATTTRAADTIETPLGTNECLRYTRTDGTTVSTFWFARSTPGMPIRYQAEESGRVVSRVTMIENVLP